MKQHGKRMLSRLLALVMAVTLLAGLGAGASADGTDAGYVAKDGYVYHFVTDTANLVWVYAQFSPFVPTLSYDGASVNGLSIIFGLTYDGTPFESLYCTDMPVDANSNGANYRPLNLSDSTYAAALADKLRAIVLHTYPHLEVDAVAKASGITGLTRGEAITASQLAIWKTAHGDTVQVTDFLNYTTSGNQRPSEIQNLLNAERIAYNAATDDEKAAVKARIEALYNYLMALPEQSATKQVVSEASFVQKDTKPTVTDNGDDTYNITVHTTVSVQMDDGDSLTLSAYMEGNKAYYVEKKLQNGINDCTLTIKNVPAEVASGAVVLAIDGEQTLNDVYLVDAKGIRGVSQSMIGSLTDTVPVHAETKAEPDRVLHIHKTDNEKNGLANISFNLFYVGSVEDYLSGELGIGTKPTDADIEKYADSTKLVGTLTTDENGEASLNLGTTDGVYLVRELPNDAVEKPCEPFFVVLPDWSRGENGEPAYEITAEPKNAVATEEVDITKDVTELDNKSDTYDVGAEHSWIIRTTIPKSIASGKEYTITDTLDYRLDLVSIDRLELREKIANDVTPTQWADSEPVVLTRDVHYTVTTGKTTDTDGHTVDTFTVSLTEKGMQKIAQTVGTSYASYELHTYFTAKINENAQMGVNIPNEADIRYTNSVGKTFEDTSDQPEVHTGGALLLKVDASNKEITLGGATFEVYRMATQEEVAADKEKNELPQITVGETTYLMVKVSFYATPDLTKEKVTSVTTTADGKAYIYGLAYGEYYLVETKAPDGYNVLREPTKFEINETSHQVEHALRIENTSGVELPTTGGIGTGVFTATGALLTAAALILLLRRRETA